MLEIIPEAALLIVAHGTRSERGTASARKLAELVAARIYPSPVELAFLELQTPTIAEGLKRLKERGAEELGLVVLPLLLFSAGHDKQDIPRAVAAELKSWEVGSHREGKAPAEPRGASVLQAKHLGCHHALVDLSARRFTEALQSLPQVPAADTVLLLVGRGSRDSTATAEMHEFAHLRGAGVSPAKSIQVAFLAMAEPSVEQALAELAVLKPRRIVVQPHLLFHGELVESLHAQVQVAAGRYPETEWSVAPLLADDVGQGGPADELLVSVLAARYHDAAIRIVAKPERG